MRTDAFRRLALLAYVVFPLLSLRWPLPIALATTRGEGAFDRTVLAFIAPAVLIAAAYPGWLAATFGLRSGRMWLRASVLMMLTAAALILTWMIPSAFPIATTLRNPVSNVAWVLPPVVTIFLAVRLRLRLTLKLSNQ